MKTQHHQEHNNYQTSPQKNPQNPQGPETLPPEAQKETQSTAREPCLSLADRMYMHRHN